jgi:hypothetical protein
MEVSVQLLVPDASPLGKKPHVPNGEEKRKSLVPARN